jgi:D-alanyl-D-alanine carboxypeptidase (penicillin-binding protein 5/6)
MNKKLFVWALIGALLGNLLLPIQMAKAAQVPQVSAYAAALIDVTSGRLLYEKNSTQKMRIASITKILTAVVALEQGNLSDLVRTSPRAFGTEGSSIYLKLDEEMSLHNLLYGLMLRSGNDAAVAIAEHVGGSLEGFVYLMNQKAREIGMKDSYFMNPHGLDDSDKHYSTARDMAMLTAYALKDPVFREIVKTKVKTAPSPGDSWDRKWYNKNKMLSLYEGADGIKTGYTKLAKRTLSSSATRGGVQLAAITLNAPNDWSDHARMLDYGFENYDLIPLVEKKQIFKGIKVGETLTDLVAEIDFSYALSEEEINQIDYRVVPYPLDSTVYRLGVAANLEVHFNNETIGVVPLVHPDSLRLDLKRDRFSYEPAVSYENNHLRSFTEIFVSIWKLWLEGTGR